MATLQPTDCVSVHVEKKFDIYDEQRNVKHIVKGENFSFGYKLRVRDAYDREIDGIYENISKAI